MESSVSTIRAETILDVSKLKSETIEESRAAAAALVEDATKKFEESGKEVISHAAVEVEGVIDRQRQKAVSDIETVVDRQREGTKKDLQDLMEDDVPDMVEEAVVSAADKIAERLGVVKKTAPGQDGIPVEVWSISGLGAGGVLLQFIRNWLNSKAKKQRWTPEELDKIIEEKVSNVQIN